MPSVGPRRGALHAIAGTAVALGPFLPWLRVDRSRRVVPQIGLPGLAAGIHSPVQWALVVAGCCAVGGSLLATRRAVLGSLALPAGGLALFDCYLTFGDPLVGLGGPFLPAWAWYLTALAGLTLVCLGLADLRHLAARPGDLRDVLA